MELFTLINYLFIILSLAIGWIIPHLSSNRTNYLNSFKTIKLFIPKDKADLFRRLLALLTNFLIFAFFAYNFDTSNYSLFVNLLIILIVFLISSYIVFLSVYDFEYFEIPDKSSIVLLLFLLILNLGLLTNGSNFSVVFWDNNHLIPSLNIIAGLFYSGLILLLVLITRGKGMGGGDIRIAAIIGLLLGSKLIIGFYITIFSGLFFGVISGMIKGKLKGLAIPFVPFMILGAVIGFFFAPQINDLLWKYFLSLQPY